MPSRITQLSVFVCLYISGAICNYGKICFVVVQESQLYLFIVYPSSVLERQYQIHWVNVQHASCMCLVYFADRAIA